jgi:hypothetical protein
MIRFCHTTRVSFPITDSGSAQASVAERETFVTDVDIQLPLELDACGGPDLTAIHFPPPWTVQELEACFVVTDSAGQKLAFIYHGELGRGAAAKLPSKEQARQVAANIARLPEVLRKEWRAALATSYLYKTGV